MRFDILDIRNWLTLALQVTSNTIVICCACYIRYSDIANHAASISKESFVQIRLAHHPEEMRLQQSFQDSCGRKSVRSRHLPSNRIKKLRKEFSDRQDYTSAQAHKETRQSKSMQSESYARAGRSGGKETMPAPHYDV